MKQVFSYLRIAVVATLALSLLVSLVYPVVVWGLAQTIFPRQANGSLIIRDHTVIGSTLIGQGFHAPRYFHPRPSAAGSGYDASSSGGSNFGPLSRVLLNGVDAADTGVDVTKIPSGLGPRVRAYRELNGLAADVEIPADAVSSSASGLDPHISPRNADLQAARVARARGMTEKAVQRLIREHTEGPDLGIFGDAAVNVVSLNLALDATTK